MRISILFLKAFFKMLIAMTPIWGILAILVSGLGIWVGIIEGIGWKDGLYFGWITGTTVGYGDITPHHWLAKVLSVIIGLIGIINTGIGVTIAVTAGKETLIHATRIQDNVENVKNTLKKSFTDKS
ncbi:potassium channel family protein [Desulforhopalus sp. IMCC35007]|uniref:potassium channel family protein n=1 Tax=Desulforhopalus sp. IMCC35007 TaxID=2569543 RepID=UPI0010AE73CD|nr:potassium channel family protein [Desulforhopalus sp. IMCC35007]TKB07660.1 two pore domain potassium channel family protein [Desulforhopalus sp. IMCC35007]